MKGDPIVTNILSMQIIPNADSGLLKELGAGPGDRSLGIISTDSDDVSYIALDEATKQADVRVLYARSMYAGAKNASTKLAGEFIGILSAPGPSDARSGLEAAERCVKYGASFFSANDEGSVYYLAHCVSQSGTYLSKLTGLEPGAPIAYLIAPPPEAIAGIDAALKAAKVRIVLFYGPPTETNFAGALLSGDQAACKAACEAFAESVCDTAARPLRMDK
ncbi:MAG: ethanolamine utilization microcompartment protein EutL [Treponema sp.]|nr:ethanolamine utilization microcompartment protein EutL [Treponema sp.]